jgi:S-formylglutathione hydrolase FrmB
MLTAIVLAAAGPAWAGAAPGANVWKKYLVESPSTGKIERFWVGHPASIKEGAAGEAARRYPVIYFLPGLLDGDDSWKTALDGHLAKYEIIAVCPAVGGATWYMNSPAQPWMRWGDYLTEDLWGFVESHYPASGEKGQRGLAGISAGAQAFYHAMMRPDLYGSVSVLSGACELRGYVGAVGLDYWIGPRSPEALALCAERSCVVVASRLEGPLPFDLFLDAGDKDGALPQMEALRKTLDAKGAKYRWFLGQGVHDWSYWKTRANDHLAWHAEQFDRNRREGRFAEKAPAKGAELKVLTALPDIALSAEAERRLRAPWSAAVARPEVVTGLPKDGGPLSASDARYKEVKLAASLGVHGHAPGLFSDRLTVRAGTPLPREGTLALRLSLRSGNNTELLVIPAAFTVPAGEPDRRADLRARLVIEMKPPDPLRGGILAALQVFDAGGNPQGEPIVRKAVPGSLEIERWVVSPRMLSEWTLSLSAEKALPLAAVYDARLEAEP